MFQHRRQKLVESGAQIQAFQTLSVRQMEVADMGEQFRIHNLMQGNLTESLGGLEDKYFIFFLSIIAGDLVQYRKQVVPADRLTDIVKCIQAECVRIVISAGTQVDNQRFPKDIGQMLPQADTRHVRHEDIKQEDVVSIPSGNRVNEIVRGTEGMDSNIRMVLLATPFFNNF